MHTDSLRGDNIKLWESKHCLVQLVLQLQQVLNTQGFSVFTNCYTFSITLIPTLFALYLAAHFYSYSVCFHEEMQIFTCIKQTLILIFMSFQLLIILGNLRHFLCLPYLLLSLSLYRNEHTHSHTDTYTLKHTYIMYILEYAYILDVRMEATRILTN